MKDLICNEAARCVEGFGIQVGVKSQVFRYSINEKDKFLECWGFQNVELRISLSPQVPLTPCAQIHKK